MFVAFFKSHVDKNCECEIAKFVDRIWIDKSGNLTCIRTFIVHVAENSPPLQAIRMLIPSQQTPELYEISDTCLTDDYLFNHSFSSTGSYEIKSLDIDRTYGKVYCDYFEVDVYTDNVIKSFECPKKTSRVVSIEFREQPITPGTFRLIRITFKISSPLVEIFPRVYSLQLHYFDKALVCGAYERLDIKTLEVPVKKKFNPQIKQGGFDIFLYLPENLSSTRFNALTQTTSNHLPDGTNSEKPCQQFVWRGEAAVPDDVKYLKAGEAFFTIEGLLNDPYEMEEIRAEIETLKNETCTLKDDTCSLKLDTTVIKGNHRKAMWVGIIALFIGALSFLMAISQGYNVSPKGSITKSQSEPGRQNERLLQLAGPSATHFSNNASGVIDSSSYFDSNSHTERLPIPMNRLLPQEQIKPGK
ncbi:MAG: hypothetical protein JRG73_03610 [Deltaproteobacteria bacterium]|nr:hypothetical protein [Deltaproteobacteria bacterium]MBW2306000.1 hypothetical protein [Deltaproteobacteria bacterium]